MGGKAPSKGLELKAALSFPIVPHALFANASGLLIVRG